LHSSAPNVFGALLRKEKDEASLPICFRPGSSNAFIPRFAGAGGVLFQNSPQLRTGLSTKNRPPELFSADKLKDQS
jgi:hypothetical protein